MRARNLIVTSGLYLLLIACALPDPVDGPESPSRWLPFAAVFRADKQAVMKRAMTGTQSQFYVDYLKDPGNPERMRRIADLHFHLGDYPRAARWYFRVLQAKPEDLEAPVWFAESLYHAGGRDPALRVLEALSEHGQDTKITRTLRAEIYYANEKYDAAKSLLEGLLAEAHNQPENQERDLLREMVTRNLQVVEAAIASSSASNSGPGEHK